MNIRYIIKKRKFDAMCFFLVFFFISFVAFVIKAAEFYYLLRNPFFFFKIRFNHISKNTIILWYVKILTFLLQVSFFLYYFIRPKSLLNFVCSFIFDELTSKVTDVSAVFLWSQQSYEIIVRIISKKLFSYGNKRIISRKLYD